MTNTASEAASIQWALDAIKRKLTDTEAAKIAPDLDAIQTAVDNLQSVSSCNQQ